MDDAERRTDTAEPTDLEAGAKLGPFVVSRVLGRGGMGIVYAGQDARTGAVAAIKTVSRGSAAFMSYVRHEASTLSRIRHPGVVQILGLGVEAGLPWYAMELLAGRTLADLLEPGGVGTAPAASLAPGPGAQGTRDAAPAAPTALTAPTAPTAPTALTAPTAPTAVLRPQGHAPTELQPASAPRAADTARGTEDTVSGTPPPPGHVTGRSLGGAGAQDAAGPAAPGPIACDLGRILPIMRGVCDALAFVHGEGVVHRDLKPDNIFIRAGELPVLVDFGLATQIVAEGRDVLQHVSVAGSLGYMAPEQLRGELLDARCDLYALGCILYRAVTGRMPFQGPTWRIIAGHLMDPPVPAGQLVVGLPPALDELIAGLLVKERDQRVGSAEAADAALARAGGARCRWAAPLPPPQPYLYRPPFVGRADVLGQLVERLQRFTGAPGAAHAGRRTGGVVLIGGESGAGKTRLVLEAVKQCAEADVTTVTCACAPGGGPFQALRELFRALVEHCVAGGPGEIERVLGAGAAVLALYSAELAELPGVAALREPEALPSAAARARVLRTLAATLRAFAAPRPLLLIVDDVHLADSFTLDLLAHLQGVWAEERDAVRALAPQVLAIGCYRTEERGPALEALAGHPEVLALAVERMTEAEVGQMVQGMLALAEPPPAFVAFLARESGGNPFFVAEYLRTAVAERVLVRDGRGRWKIADTSVPTEAICEALPLPRSLRHVVELRLGKLAPRTREVLDAAAVIGRRLDRALLADVAGLGGDAVLEALDEMVAAQVLEPVDDEGYRFVHDKLHELPAAALPPARSRQLHGRTAAAMERRYGDAPAEHEAAIGRHWARAGNAPRAAALLHAAGDRARRVHSVDAAIELYRAARQQVELAADAAAAGDAATAGDAPAAGAWRAQARELDEKIGDALAFSSQHAPARAAFQQALAGLGPAEPLARARLLRKIAKTWESTHAYPEALAGYAELEALIDAAPDLAGQLEPEWIQLMVGRAWIYYWSNRVDEMNAVIDRVRPVIEARGTALDRYRFYLALVTRDYRRDRYRISEETLAHGRQCVAAARDASSIGEIAFARFVRGFGLLFARRLDEAEAEIEAALAAARKISDAVAETRAIAYLGLIHRLAGRAGDTEATAAAALAMARARKMGDYEGVSLALLGWVARAAGDRDRAAALCRQAIATWNAMAYPFPFRWIATLLLFDLEVGRAPAGELAALAQGLCAPTQALLPDPLDAALGEAGAAGERGDGAAAEAALRRAVELARQLGYI